MRTTDKQQPGHEQRYQLQLPVGLYQLPTCESDVT